MKLDEYLKQEILEQGCISSFTKEGTIEVYSRKNWEDYSNIFVKYTSRNIFFKLTKQFPTFEQFKTQFTEDVNIIELYEFICSPDKRNPNITVYYAIKKLFKSMEYNKLPTEKYIKMLKNNELDYIDL